MLKMSELKELDTKTIKNKVGTLRRNLFQVKMEKITSGIEKTHQLKDLRRDIARCLFELGSRSTKS